MCYLNFFQAFTFILSNFEKTLKKTDRQITNDVEKILFFSSYNITHSGERTQMLENEGEDMSTKLLTTTHSF